MVLPVVAGIVADEIPLNFGLGIRLKAGHKFCQGELSGA
jgi:hypothetical protein